MTEATGSLVAETADVAALPARKMSRSKRRWAVLAGQLGVLVVFIVVWELVSGNLIDVFYLPKPAKVFGELMEWLGDGSLFGHIMATFVPAAPVRSRKWSTPARQEVREVSGFLSNPRTSGVRSSPPQNWARPIACSIAIGRLAPPDNVPPMDEKSLNSLCGVDAVEHAIRSRKSIRAFLNTPIEPGLVQRLLDVAARAPSGTNMQPWRVYVLSGAAKERLSDAVLTAHDARASKRANYQSEYKYYPDAFSEPYLGRRRKIGWELYRLLGIEKGDTARMHAQHGRNFQFFGAPVGLIFTIDRQLNIGSWLDYGMFLQNVMVAARAHGLDTCPQAAFATFHAVIRETVPGLTEGEVVICGMALGYADPAAPENALTSDRVASSEFATFIT